MHSVTIRLALIASVACGLAVVWANPVFPTQDGASHVYSAHVQSELAAENPTYTPIYEAHWDVVPNLLAAGVLRLLVPLTGGDTAEKLLISFGLLLFCFGLWMLCRRADQPSAVIIIGPALFLGLPLHMGFYSFSLGLALVPVAWALALRSSAHQATGAIVGWSSALAVVAVAAWFAHALAAMAVLVGSGALLLFRLRRGNRRAVRSTAAALAPAATLLIIYLVGRDGAGPVDRWSVGQLVETLVSLRALASFTGPQEYAAMALALTLTVIAVIGVRRNRAARPWFVVSGVFSLVFLAIPNGGDGFWFVSERLSLLPWLALLPAAAVVRNTLPQLAVYALLTSALLWPNVAPHAAINAGLDEYEAVTRNVDGATVLAIETTPNPGYRFRPYLHALSRVAARDRFVDGGHYEVHTDHFQLRLRRYVVMPNPDLVMSSPDRLDFARFVTRVPRVIVRGHSAALTTALETAGYARMQSGQALEWYERK
ncbi:MAG: hypothetical protein ACI9OJ_001632 [Myxococcota bacterium]